MIFEDKNMQFCGELRNIWTLLSRNNDKSGTSMLQKLQWKFKELSVCVIKCRFMGKTINLRHAKFYNTQTIFWFFFLFSPENKLAFHSKGDNLKEKSSYVFWSKWSKNILKCCPLVSPSAWSMSMVNEKKLYSRASNILLFWRHNKKKEKSRPSCSKHC